MTTREITILAPSWPNPIPSPIAWATRAWRAWADWRIRQRTINELRVLSDHTLKDIGIVRGDINYIVHSRSRH